MKNKYGENISPYDLGAGGGLPRLKRKILKKIREQEKDEDRNDSSPYMPRKTPWRP